MEEIDALSDEEGLQVFNQPEAIDDQKESVSKFSKLKQDEKFQDLMNKVKEDLEAQSTKKDFEADINLTHQLYDLIARTNETLRMLQPEIMSIHKTARDLFQARFPELESIVLNPVDYARVV